MPKQISVRLTDELYEQIKKLAEEDRRSISDYIRIVISDAIQEKGES